jgi:hypothetical protein
MEKTFPKGPMYPFPVGIGTYAARDAALRASWKCDHRKTRAIRSVVRCAKAGETGTVTHRLFVIAMWVFPTKVDARSSFISSPAWVSASACSPVPVARVLARIRLLIKTDPINPMTFFWAPPQKS